MTTLAALTALNEVSAVLGTTVKIADVVKLFPAHVGHVKRNSINVARGVFDFSAAVSSTPVAAAAPIKTESDAEIAARLTERFDALEIMAHATGVGINRALVVSGAPGLGKSFGIEKKLAELENMGASKPVFVKGYVRPLSMYKLMWENRFSSSVIVFDDADSVFADDVALNLLKAACDSSDVRKISWMSETKIEDEDGESIPKTFEFEGNIIFITNYDFDSLIARGNKMAPHFQALMSRALYLDLGLKTNRDYYVRVQQVVEGTDMLDKLTDNQKSEVMAFVEKHQLQFRDFSLRMVKKLAAIRQMGSNWESLARMTLLK